MTVTRRQVQGLRELRDEFFNCSPEPRLDAIPELERLREQAWRIGMLSNCPAESSEALVNQPPARPARPRRLLM